MSPKESKVAIIPLGGLGEIGKNMTAIRCGNSIIVIDWRHDVSRGRYVGIDTVIPDYSFLLENRKKIKAIVLTHGHEDHIGALPYVLRDIDVPVYGTKLTLALVQNKLKEAKVKANLNIVNPKDVLQLSPFKVEFMRVNHSIADAVAIAVHTPAGIILHTGDFKIDMTPVDGQLTDFNRLTTLGEEGVLLMLSDSTNVEKPGYTMSEKSVGPTFDDAFRNAKGRIIIASFATNIHRLQQAINSAAKYNRKVAIIGRSMVNVMNIAREQGYLKLPRNVLIESDAIDTLPLNKVTILATGSQGEPMSSLTRIANGEHKQIKILQGDTIIISAVPIPGNETSVARNIDLLYKLGADVIYERAAGIHVSGHASQEELKMMLAMVRPKYFMPVHGEIRMLYKHANLAREMGILSENIFVMENGQVLELGGKKDGIKGKVASGKIMIDGMGVEDVGNIVLRDRRQLARDGIMVVVVTVDRCGNVVASPEMVSRGFIYIKEAEPLLEEGKQRIIAAMAKYEGKRIRDFSAAKQDVKDAVGRLFHEQVKRKPMIIPVIIELDKK